MPWVSDRSAPLVVDLYELTMAAAYLGEGISEEPATFELWVRRLPEERRFLVAAGMDDAVDALTSWRFSADAVDYLGELGLFAQPVLDHFGAFRFSADVWAVPDGTVAFAGEPLVRVTGTLLEAQIVETFLLNTVGFQTMVASKAARVYLAAGGRPFSDFGARRAHAADAALKGARAAYVGGADTTSMVLAGKEYDIPVTGTMAHSYVLAHDSERAAFTAFARAFPHNAVLLIDTYDTVAGARIAAEVADDLAADGIRVAGVRLDSGDLAALAHSVRRVLDDAGHSEIRIVASGGLDEHRISALMAAGAPVDAFGVGTSMTASIDAPHLDIVYKLVEDRHGPRMKTSIGKETLPGVKQVFRADSNGTFAGDTIALASEELEGTPLLHQVMSGGARIGQREHSAAARSRTLQALDSLPDPVRDLAPAASPAYPVAVSPGLARLRDDLTGRG